nr:proteasome (prosome macropain) subunit beta [Hymenolepis microstoma]
MEYVIGIAFKDFAIVAADARLGVSIITLKDDVDKTFELSKHCLLAACGEPGDAVQFAEFIQQNMQLYEIRNGYELSPLSTANFTRGKLAEALRTRNAYHVNSILAGYDPESGAKVYYMDYLASLIDLPYAVHGHGGYVTLGILDSEYDPAMNKDAALNLVKMCVAELRKRFLLNFDRFVVKIVDKDGIKRLPDLV